MSSIDPFAGVRWPTPMLAPIASHRERLVKDAVWLLRLETVSAHGLPSEPAVTGWSARIAFVKKLLRAAAEQFIPMAEEMSAASGADKKTLVKRELLKVLEALEKRVNLVPGFGEPVARWLVRQAIDGIIETVFRQLEARGIVNA